MTDPTPAEHPQTVEGRPDLVEMRRIIDASTVPTTCHQHRTYDCWMCRPRIAIEAVEATR